MGETCDAAGQYLFSDDRVSWRLQGPYNQIAGDDLQDLGLQALPPREDLLQNANEQMAQRGTDKHSVEGHLGHT